jgi:hypothetical protein
MVKPVKPGTVLVGHELGAGMEVGGQVEIEGKSFTIASIEPEFGDLKDVQFVMHLDDAQTILDRGGKINQILALNCKCKGNRLSKVRAEVEEVLPDTKVAEHFTRAEAREKQRDLVEQARSEQLSRLKSNRDAAQRSLAVLLGVLSPIVVFGSALFVGVLTWLNVRERCHEIGVLRALGKGDLNIVALILARCALTGLIGGAIGVATYFAGSATAPSWLNEEALSSVQFIAPTTSLLILAIAGAPLVAIISGYLPTLVAIRQDTARVLAAN